ncbi:MAG: ABC transporter ATP-binding protein [Synergistaceae bacterium]|jgi:peptide/nickel transport system ATP-binding protein/oligopeptide transport system ATP-binding protein|nr:ABC transporter ATP-binding protein [Synergistaceae bacterium]
MTKGKNALVEAIEISKQFRIGKNRAIKAVNGISLTIRKGGIFGLVGESGCGKSTFGRLLLRLIEPTSGKVFFKGTDITSLSNREFSPIRRSMQMVFQDPYGSFNPKMRIGSSLKEVGKYFGLSKESVTARVSELLERVSLSEDLLLRSPRELSGGQLQRLAIARAIFNNADFIVADEPVSALDVSVQAQLLNLFCDLRESTGLTMLFISHDISVINYLCDSVGVMYLGRLVETADTADLFHDARHPYTQALLASAPLPGRKIKVVLPGDAQDSAETVGAGCEFYSRCPPRSDKCKEEAPVLRRVSGTHCVACHLCGASSGYVI